MSATLEEVLEEVKTLPHEQQEVIREVMSLVSAAYLAGKAAEFMELLEKALSLSPDDMRRLRVMLNTVNWNISSADARRRLARGVRGRYAHLPTSSEAFAARKAEEITLEDRRGRP